MEDIYVTEEEENMEETSENSATNQKKIYGDINEQNKNRIQVSNTKKPLFFDLNLAKRHMKQYDDLEVSAMGMDFKEKSTVGTKDDVKCRIVQKAKIEILLGKVENGREPKITTAAAPKKNYGKMAENGKKRENEEKLKTIAATEPQKSAVDNTE